MCILFARNRCLLPAICRRICSVTPDKFAFASTPVSDRMPKSRETKAALEVNAGAICLAGVAVLPHRYVAVPLDFFNLLIKGRLKIRRPFFCLFINDPSPFKTKNIRTHNTLKIKQIISAHRPPPRRRACTQHYTPNSKTAASGAWLMMRLVRTS